jgi:probable rRNA maturation factor
MTEGLEVAVCVSCPAWTAALPAACEMCRDAARAAFGAAAPDIAWAEASLMLADDAMVRDLNRTYRGHDMATNVLAFPGLDDAGAPGAPTMLGDVVVAYETAAAEATRSRTVLADHLCHLVVHGILHLLGHDHETNADAERMEGLEIRALASLGVGLGDPVVPGDDERR